MRTTCDGDGDVLPSHGKRRIDFRGDGMNVAVRFTILTNIRFIFGKLEVSNVNEKLGLVFRESAKFGL